MSATDTGDGFSSEPFDHSHALAQLQQALTDIPDSRHYVIALSGGLDSSSLLRIAVPLLKARGVALSAVHVNHGLSRYAKNWEAFCLNLCQSLHVECLLERVEVRPDGEGWEAAARKQRYRVFEKVLPEGGLLLQAHHLNDQLETVFMRVRQQRHMMTWGGIPCTRRLGGGYVHRPWLGIERKLIEHVARRYGWDWVEDESNRDERFERNHVRHRLLPRLSQQYPDLPIRLKSLSDRVSRLRAIDKRLLEHGLRLCKPVGDELCVDGLKCFTEPAQKRLLRYWLDCRGVAQPPESIFKRLWTEVLPSKPDSGAKIVWGNHQLRIYSGCLFLLSGAELGAESPEPVLVYIGQGARQIPFGRYLISLMPLESDSSSSEGVVVAFPKGCRLKVCSRKDAEKVVMRLGSTSLSIKKSLQKAGVPPWRREEWPLLCVGNTLVWAGGGAADSAVDSAVDRAFHPNIAGPEMQRYRLNLTSFADDKDIGAVATGKTETE